MDGIRALLYVIILIISLVNIISYYSKKRNRKDSSREIISRTPSHRTVSEEERRLIKTLYGEEISPGEEVYAVGGEYTSLILQVKNSATETVHALGGVVVQLENYHEAFLAGDNRAEILLPHRKKGALILSLNDGYRLTEEGKVRSALEGGATYTAETCQIQTDRLVTGKELNRLYRDFRWLPALGFSLLTLLSLVLGGTVLRLALAAGALALFLTLILPGKYPVPPRGRMKNLIRLSGILGGEPGRYTMDRFSLSFPPGWDLQLAPGSRITLKAYRKLDNAYLLDVLELSPLHSVQREEDSSPTVRADRFVLAGILTGIILLISFFALKMPREISILADYYATEDLPSDFTGWEEISAYPFEEGQFVRLTGLRAIPPYQSGYGPSALTDDTPFSEPDLSGLAVRLEQLERVQETGEFIHLTSYRLNDDMTYYSFQLEILSRFGEEPSLLSDWAEVFSDSPAFALLAETAEALDRGEGMENPETIPYPEGGRMKERAIPYGEGEEAMSVDFLLDMVERAPQEFLREQSDLLNARLDTMAEEQFAHRPAILFSSSGMAGPGSFHFTESDLSLYSFSTYAGRDPYTIRTDLPGEERISDLASLFRNPTLSVSSEGILFRVVRNGEGRVTEIFLDEGRNYNGVEETLLKGGLFLLPLIYLAAGALFFLLGKKRVRGV